MAKKKEVIQDEFGYPIVEESEQDSFDLGSIPEMSVDETEAKLAEVSGHITLRILRSLGDAGYLVEGSDGATYIASGDLAFENRVVTAAQDDSRLEKLYTWEKEIEAMLPDRAAMVKAVQRSLYMSGAFRKGDLKKNEVARNWNRHAFPYTIKEEIEE